MDITNGPSVEIELAGAKIIIPSATIAEIWLARLRGDQGDVVAPPRIGSTSSDGGDFMGIVRGENGELDHCIFDLGEAPERMNYEAAKKWAAEKGGSLPTRREQSIMFGNRAEGQYKQEWYWSSEQCAGVDGYAWCQYFGDGSQSLSLKGLDYRARAVRRQVIQ